MTGAVLARVAEAAVGGHLLGSLNGPERLRRRRAGQLLQVCQGVAVVVAQPAEQLLLARDGLLDSAEDRRKLGRVVVDVATVGVEQMAAPREVKLWGGADGEWTVEVRSVSCQGGGGEGRIQALPRSEGSSLRPAGGEGDPPMCRVASNCAPRKASMRRMYTAGKDCAMSRTSPAGTDSTTSWIKASSFSL